jgi:hypothetical protein
LSFSGLRPETHSLFAKREAKTLIRVLRILIQSAETAVSAGGGATTNFYAAQFVHMSVFETSFVVSRCIIKIRGRTKLSQTD